MGPTIEEIQAEKQRARDAKEREFDAHMLAYHREDWATRCAYHKPSEEGIKAIEVNRANFSVLGYGLLELLPACEETDIALHHLQQALMWANAAAAYRIEGSEPAAPASKEGN